MGTQVLFRFIYNPPKAVAGLMAGLDRVNLFFNGKIDNFF